MPTPIEMEHRAMLYSQAANLAIRLHRQCAAKDSVEEKRRACKTAMKASLRAERRWWVCCFTH